MSRSIGFRTKKHEDEAKQSTAAKTLAHTNNESLVGISDEVLKEAIEIRYPGDELIAELHNRIK